jgi:catechol 2,3-dioxygenase
MKLGHVHLKVDDLGAAERFYCEVLGLTVKERISDSFVFLSFGGAHHDLALQVVHVRGRRPISNGIGLYHSAFEVESSAALLGAIERLKKIHAPIALVDHGISWAVYTEDPAGNGVEVYLDRRRARAGREKWHATSAVLTENQIKRDAMGAGGD